MVDWLIREIDMLIIIRRHIGCCCGHHIQYDNGHIYVIVLLAMKGLTDNIVGDVTLPLAPKIRR